MPLLPGSPSIPSCSARLAGWKLAQSHQVDPARELSVNERAHDRRREEGQVEGHANRAGANAFARGEAIVPLYGGLRQLLAGIPKRATTILTNSRGRPWTTDGFGSTFNKAKRGACLIDRNLRFHDLRGTAATRFYVAGLSERVIAEIMGWEEEHVARIIRRYVGRTAATMAIIHQLDQAERRTAGAKPAAKPAS